MGECSNYSSVDNTGFCESKNRPEEHFPSIVVEDGIPDWCPLEYNYIDNMFWDNIDAAHPAFWRGQLSGVNRVCERIEDILDGKDDGRGVFGDERLEKVRRSLLGIKRNI